MGPIALTQLPETDLIVRGKFPTRDETAFDREAGKFRTSSGALAESQTAVVVSSGYTVDEFWGRTGDALVHKLGGHHQKFGEDSADLAAVASWLTLAGENVRSTKKGINDVVTRYHDAYAGKQKEAADNSWPQKILADAKSELVSEAQGDVDKLFADYEARHANISSGIVNGTTPPDNVSAVSTSPTQTPAARTV